MKDNLLVFSCVDVVAAAKACLPHGAVKNPEVLQCLDFSLTPDQLVKLQEAHSIFSNGEICRSVWPSLFNLIILFFQRFFVRHTDVN